MPFPFSERLGAAPPHWQPQTCSPTAQAFWAPWKAPSQSLQSTEGLPPPPHPVQGGPLALDVWSSLGATYADVKS